MKVKLSTTDFDFFVFYFTCAIDNIQDVKKGDSTVSFEIKSSDLTAFEVDMDSDIIHNGMDNQNTVNETGKRMYMIYDTIIDQL